MIASPHLAERSMPKFFNSDLAELTHQLAISPRRLRVEQLNGIENLLGLVEEGSSYPYDFVCYHITGYRKRSNEAEFSIPGKAMVADLVTMAEVISRKANMSFEEITEPYLSQPQVAERLGVSTKTVRRWRSRGLMGLRVVYKDGVNRLAFLERSLQRFNRQHPGLVAKGSSFSQLTSKEKQHIVDLAREIIAETPMKLHACAQLVAKETGRAVETVRYTLRRYDQRHREDAIFAPGGMAVHSQRHLAMWRCHQTGESIGSIASAFDTTKAQTQRILRHIQVETWKQTPLEWMHNELFDSPAADKFILDEAEPEASSAALPKAPKDLPPYLQALYQTPLLTFAQEQYLFRRYNYLKCRTETTIRAIDSEAATQPQVDAVEAAMSEIDALRRRIVRSNLRLVVSITKKHVGWRPDFFEIISDGNISLMRAVEKFDYARGNKFSTYATWAIVKNYARSIPEQHYRYSRYITGQDELLAVAADYRAVPTSDTERRQLRDVITAGLEVLPPREREIVSHHFGLNGDGGSLTLEQIGKRFGVTKERIRQIERRALNTLREVLPANLVDALGD